MMMEEKENKTLKFAKGDKVIMTIDQRTIKGVVTGHYQGMPIVVPEYGYTRILPDRYIKLDETIKPPKTKEDPPF